MCQMGFKHKVRVVAYLDPELDADPGTPACGAGVSARRPGLSAWAVEPAPTTFLPKCKKIQKNEARTHMWQTYISVSELRGTSPTLLVEPPNVLFCFLGTAATVAGLSGLLLYEKSTLIHLMPWRKCTNRAQVQSEYILPPFGWSSHFADDPN